MGSTKALLTLEGRTFLARVVGALTEGGCEPVVVVTGPEHDEDARLVAEHARRLGAVVAINPNRDSQQVESLRLALEQLPPAIDGVLVSPVDAPGVSAELVRELIETGRDAPVAIPTSGGRRGHPVLFGRTVLPEFANEDLPQGARTIIRRHGAQLVEMPAGPEVLLDVDTPAEYDALREQQG